MDPLRPSVHRDAEPPDATGMETCLAALAEAPRGRRVLLTAGPTAEDIDAVRFLTNRSSGRMGFALAEAARERGCSVLLLLGATPLPPPTGISTCRVRSAEEMRGAVLAALPWCDILLMAAAVADYTPVAPETERKRHKDGDEWVLRLRRTRDILRDVAGHPARRGKTVIGFSLDVDLDLEEGARKLREKSLDGIVVNGAAALGADRTEAVLLRPSAPALPLGTGSKREVADALLRAVGPPLPP